MRADMHKVICESPRAGQYWARRFPRPQIDFENTPKVEGIKRPHRNKKWFGEHLGPLKRWLRSQVGRDWNEVYSEASQVIKPDSVVRAHIRFHMLEMVQRDTFIRDSEVWCITRRRWSESNEMPVSELGKRWHPFYVHPDTGLLCEIPDKPRRLTLQETDDLRFGAVRKRLPKDTLLLKLEGLWFDCRMVRFPQQWGSAPFDVIFKCLLIDSHAREAYGEPVYCVSKRQLSRKELRASGLANSTTATDCFLAVLGNALVGRIRRSNGNPLRSWLQCGIYFRIEASAAQFFVLFQI